MPESWVYVPDRAFRAPPAHATTCHVKGCGQPSVAEVDRRLHNPRITDRYRWYGWCAEHLEPYHRVAPDGVTVECQVAPGSPAAQRGWTR